MRVHSQRSRIAWLLPLLLVATGICVALLYRTRSASDPDEVWQQAELDLSADRFDRAEQSLATLGRLRPPIPKDWILRAQVAISRHRPDDALAALARIPDRDPLAVQARLLAGQIELRRNRIRAAEAHLLAALALDPKLVQARRELVYIYGIQLRRNALGEQFRALSESTPLTFENVFHWCLTRNVVWDPQEIVEAMNAFLQADPGDRWSRLALVESLRQLGRLDEAEKAIAALPDSDPDARAARVRLALARGDDGAAESLLAEGPTDHPELARLRGRFAIAHRNPQAALEHFRRAYQAEPDDRETLMGLAAALTMTGARDLARPYFDEARDHDRLGTLMQRVSLPENQKDPKLLRDLGAACEAIHRLPEARAWYNLAIGLNPLDSEAQQALFRLDAALAKGKAAPRGS